MQDYKAIDENENMSDAPAQMAKNDKAIISNFSGAEEPSTKMQGQFYFDTSENKLKFYNGSKFVAEIPCSITGTAARAKADESGRVIADSYLGKTEKAVSAGALQTLERNTAYKVGDIAYTTQLPAGYYLECVTAGTTGNTEPTFGTGRVTLDGTAEWSVQQSASVASVEGIAPIGSVVAYAGTSVPSGYLACNGAAISRTTYAKLFDVIGTTYGSGDGSTTFNLPNLENNSFMEFSSSVGTAKSAGLPNITGEAGNPTTEGTSAISSSGALTATIIASGRAAGSGGSSMKISIDASKSSSIYGNSTTVQPKSLTVRAIIKY